MRRPGRPAVLLLHGFPELAYSWRKVMLPLAAAGYHVIAPDQRGYGRTTGWDDSYDADPDPFRILNMVRDAIGLVYALGHRSVAMVVGHDAGAPVASWAALIRPDIFRSVTIMSSPFEGPPSLPFDTANGAAAAAPGADRRRARRGAGEAQPAAEVLPELSAHARGQRQHAACAAGAPRVLPRLLPLQERRLEREQAASVEGADRRGDGANPHLLRDGEGQRHGGNRRAVHAVGGRDRGVQVADRGRGRSLRDRVRQDRSSPARFRAIACGAARIPRASPRCARSQAAPSMCRRCSSPARATGASIRRPAPWTRCRRSACTRMVGFHLLDGAGHWVQQEQPEQVSSLLARVPEAARISERQTLIASYKDGSSSYLLFVFTPMITYGYYAKKSPPCKGGVGLSRRRI